MTYVGKKPADIIATAVDTTTGTFSGDLTVDTNTLYVDSANNRVGVGTVSPAEKVDIVGNDANAVSLQIDNNETASASVLLGQAGSSGYGVTSWGSSVGILDGTNGLAIGSADPSAPLLFYTSNTRTERARIDSSGNLLVSKTAGGSGTAGIQLESGGRGGFTKDGAYVTFQNRLSSDGEISRFMKDGGTVGSISTISGDILIGTGDTALRFHDGNDAIYPFETSTPALRDASIDLGGASQRFKDLYLSGGVYLGGTGSANKLDDYEEGAWTPAYLNDGATTYDHQIGRYVKIGQLVMAWFHIDVNSNSIGTNSLRVSNLPFTGLNVNNEASYGAVSTLHCNNWSTTNKPDNGLVPSSSTYADLYKSQGTTGTSQLTGNDVGGGNLIGCVIYRAA